MTARPVWLRRSFRPAVGGAGAFGVVWLLLRLSENSGDVHLFGSEFGALCDCAVWAKDHILNSCVAGCGENPRSFPFGRLAV